ncbi:MAG: hypothetical protein R2787_14830 [Saprospiraceae bacterium]
MSTFIVYCYSERITVTTTTTRKKAEEASLAHRLSTGHIVGVRDPLPVADPNDHFPLDPAPAEPVVSTDPVPPDLVDTEPTDPVDPADPDPVSPDPADPDPDSPTDADPVP